MHAFSYLQMTRIQIYVDLIRNINSEVVNNIQTHSIP